MNFFYANEIVVAKTNSVPTYVGTAHISNFLYRPNDIG